MQFKLTVNNSYERMCIYTFATLSYDFDVDIFLFWLINFEANFEIRYMIFLRCCSPAWNLLNSKLNCCCSKERNRKDKKTKTLRNQRLFFVEVRCPRNKNKSIFVINFDPNVSWLFYICDDLREKGLFQDVDVKIQVRTYLNFDVNVLKHAFFPWIITYNVLYVLYYPSVANICDVTGKMSVFLNI